MNVRALVVDQFRRPHGALGRLAGWIMATRGSNRARNAWTVGLLEIGPNDRVLEIGCGPGLGLAAAARHAWAWHVAGLDHSATMLDQARARNAPAVAAGRVELILGGLERLTDLPGPFEKIFSINVVQFLPEVAPAFATLFGKLGPSGVVATTYMPRHRNPTRADAERMAGEIAAAMARTGFASIRTETLDLKPVPAVCVLGRRPPN